MDTFTIKNQLLNDALFGDAVCIKKSTGYFYADKKHFGRAFIEFCTMRIFNIHRMPGFEPFYISQNICNYDLRDAYGNLSCFDIDDACQELLALYEFTQERLKKSALNNNGTISLVRALCDYERKEVEPQLLDKKENIEIPVNIINSYAYDKELFCYDSDISISRDVPIENILFVDKFVQNPNGICKKSLVDCEHEVWVIEKNIFGKINLHQNCFKIKENYTLQNTVKYATYVHSKKEDTSILNINDESRLPCNKNWLTKKIIAHNQKQILRNKKGV